MTGEEREAWREVAEQVEAAGTYTRADYSAFRLAVKALAAVYTADPELKETSLKSLIENASKMLGRFGLDPISRGQVKLPEVEEDDEDDDLAEFLEDGEGGVQ